MNIHSINLFNLCDLFPKHRPTSEHIHVLKGTNVSTIPLFNSVHGLAVDSKRGYLYYAVRTSKLID